MPKQITGFIDRSATIDGTKQRYVLYIPRDYSEDKQWPVILFLHGSGERGTDGLKQSQVGIGSAIRMHADRYPALVVMPQCAPDSGWRGEMNRLALKAMDETITEFHGDPHRLYLTGLSMGGFGSWDIASNNPTRFAAVVPICGGGDPATMASKLVNVPIWAFHGGADPTVPPQRSRDMVDAIKAAGGTQIKYTEYPGVGHNSWDNAYNDEAMSSWLFQQKLG